MSKNPAQTEICSFVIRVWLESDDSPDEWRGHVTHVLSGDRQHFNKIDTMNAFVVRHIKHMGERRN